MKTEHWVAVVVPIVVAIPAALFAALQYRNDLPNVEPRQTVYSAHQIINSDGTERILCEAQTILYNRGGRTATIEMVSGFAYLREQLLSGLVSNELPAAREPNIAMALFLEGDGDAPQDGTDGRLTPMRKLTSETGSKVPIHIRPQESLPLKIRFEFSTALIGTPEQSQTVIDATRTALSDGENAIVFQYKLGLAGTDIFEELLGHRDVKGSALCGHISPSALAERVLALSDK